MNKNLIKRIAVCLIGIAPLGCDLSTDYSQNYSNSDDEENVDESEEDQNIIDYRKPNFRFPNERETIIYHAKRVGVDEDLMLSIREAENGRGGRQFGVMPNPRYNRDRGYTDNGNFVEYPDDGDLSKQTSWSAWTIKRNEQRYDSLSKREKAKYSDFIDYLGSKYAPSGADNDPDGLNENWGKNVRARYKVHKGGK